MTRIVFNSNSSSNNNSLISLSESVNPFAVLSSSQLKLDSAIDTFFSQTSDLKSIASLSLAGWVGQFARAGILATFRTESPLLSVFRNLASHIGSIGLEAATLEIGNNLFEPVQNPFFNSFFHSVITLGSFRIFSPLVAGQNLFFQQGVQSTALVSAHQIAARLHLQEIPTESLVEQFAGAFASNLSLEAASRIATHLTGGKFKVIERNLHTIVSAEQSRFEERDILLKYATVEDSQQLQAYSKAARGGMERIFSSYAFLFNEAYERPLIGFDRMLESRLQEIQTLTEAVQHYHENIQSSGVSILNYPNYPHAVRLIESLPDMLKEELRKTGMTPKIANQIRNKVQLAAAALGPSAEALRNSLNRAFPVRRIDPLYPKTAELDQIEGIFLAAAIGDAHGAPFEFMTPGQIASSTLDLNHFNAKRNRTPGSWTDDTLFVLATLDSVLREGAIIPRRLAQAFAALAPEQKIRGFGHATKTALKRMEKGQIWSSSGLEDSAGNGAAMRIAPIAVFSYRNLEALRKNVIITSQMTHAGYEAIAASLATAFVIAKILRQQFDPTTILQETRIFIGPGKFSSKLNDIDTHLRDDTLSTQEGIRLLGTGGVVWESVASSFYTFLRHPQDFNQILRELVQAGGDTDTMAAIAGHFYGALNGRSSISDEWIHPLEESENILLRSRRMYQLIHNL